MNLFPMIRFSRYNCVPANQRTEVSYLLKRFLVSMKMSSTQKIMFLVVGFATFLIFCPALLPRLSASSDTSNLPGPVRGQNLILFKRGVLDTRARVDLDTSEEDRQAMSSMSVSSAKRDRKSTRLNSSH